MPISIETLNRHSGSKFNQPAMSLYEAQRKNIKTAFLCHSHKDRSLIEPTIALLNQAGWRIYVDWLDAEMPNNPTRETAKKIKDRIRQMDYFLFLATENSTASRWCPWEIGYADPYKFPEHLLIIPTTKNYRTHGNEYLDLYKRIDLRSDGTLAAMDPGNSFGISLRIF